MHFKVHWTSLAKLTYAEEIEFIFLKWNYKQVDDFLKLTDDFLGKLVLNPYIGKPSKKEIFIRL